MKLNCINTISKAEAIEKEKNNKTLWHRNFLYEEIDYCVNEEYKSFNFRVLIDEKYLLANNRKLYFKLLSLVEWANQCHTDLMVQLISDVNHDMEIECQVVNVSMPNVNKEWFNLFIPTEAVLNLKYVPTCSGEIVALDFAEKELINYVEENGEE